MTTEHRIADLRKRAVQRSRERWGGLKTIPYLCSACRHEYEVPHGAPAGCPRCGRKSQTGADRADAARGGPRT